MASVLLCTGKKKRIQTVKEYYLQQAKKKKLEILDVKINTKRALFWYYDELKILFEPLDGSKGHAPSKLLNGLDSHTYKEQTFVMVNFHSQRSPDNMVKVKTLTICHSHLSKGVRAKIGLKEFKETEYRKFYQTVGELQGPLNAVIECKNNLIGEKLCDPKTVHYTF